MSKKIIYIVIGIIILGLGVWYFINQREVQPKGEQEQQEITLTSEGANWTPEQNTNLQQGLVNSVGKYLDAVLMTNAVFLTDIENTNYEEWEEKLNKAIQLWEEMEELEQKMNIVFDELEIPEYVEQQTNLSNYHLAYSNFFKDILISPAYAITEGKQGIPELGAVTAVFDSVKSGNKIRKIMEVFGWDRHTAFYHLKREQELSKSEAWDKAGDTYKRWEIAARVIKDTSKVTVFIGTNIITAGGASAAVGTLSALQVTSIIVGGTALTVEVGEDINIAIGNEDNAAVLHSVLEKSKIVTELVSIASLSDLADPGNLFYIADKAKDLASLAKDGYLYIIKDKDNPGKISLSFEPPEGIEEITKDFSDSSAKPESKETKKAGLPEGKYKIDGEEIEVKKEELENEDKEDLEEPVISDISAITDIAKTFSALKIPKKPTIQSNSTKIQTGETNTLTIDIPEEFKGPFKTEYIDVGSSGAGVVLPSISDSHNFTGEFISSVPGTFAVEIKIVDANGKIYITKTTIFVEGESAGDTGTESTDTEFAEPSESEFQMELEAKITAGEPIENQESSKVVVTGGDCELYITFSKNEYDSFELIGHCDASAEIFIRCDERFGQAVNSTTGEKLCLLSGHPDYRDGDWMPFLHPIDLTGDVEGYYVAYTKSIVFIVKNKDGESYSFTGKFINEDEVSGSGAYSYGFQGYINYESIINWSAKVVK